MQLLPTLLLLLPALFPLATPLPQRTATPPLQKGMPKTLNVRTYTYPSCRFQANSLTLKGLALDKCADATPNPVFNMPRGFASFKAEYKGTVPPGWECKVVVVNNRECDGEAEGVVSREVVVDRAAQEECFNVGLGRDGEGEDFRGFGVEWRCGEIPVGVGRGLEEAFVG